MVYCNCDDPFESNFFKYFAANFNALGLKKLITTSYTKSPIAGGQLPLFEVKGLKPKGKEPLKIEINEISDLDSDGAVGLEDIKWLLKHNANVSASLKGNGDFRSEECIELLKQADIVVTNPPFSLFREYVAQLVEYNKKFLIIGRSFFAKLTSSGQRNYFCRPTKRTLRPEGFGLFPSGVTLTSCADKILPSLI